MPNRSFALQSFWKHYNDLPVATQQLADKQFKLFSKNRNHPSLGFKQKGAVWTAEVGRRHRAIARERNGDFYWFWIGTHEAYNHLLSRLR